MSGRRVRCYSGIKVANNKDIKDLIVMVMACLVPANMEVNHDSDIRTGSVSPIMQSRRTVDYQRHGCLGRATAMSGMRVN